MADETELQRQLREWLSDPLPEAELAAVSGAVRQLPEVARLARSVMPVGSEPGVASGFEWAETP